MSHDGDFEDDANESISTLNRRIGEHDARLTKLERNQEHLMATIADLKTATDDLTTAVTALEAREASEAGENQAAIDQAHANVTAATQAINAEDQPAAPAAPPAPTA